MERKMAVLLPETKVPLRVENHRAETPISPTTRIMAGAGGVLAATMAVSSIVPVLVFGAAAIGGLKIALTGRLFK